MIRSVALALLLTSKVVSAREPMPTAGVTAQSRPTSNQPAAPEHASNDIPAASTSPINPANAVDPTNAVSPVNFADSTAPDSGPRVTPQIRPSSTEVAAPELAAGAPVTQPIRHEARRRPRSDVPAPEGDTEQWYGSQTLVVDAASMGLIGLGVATDMAELGSIGSLGYFFGSPIVHWSHGNVGKGFGSFALRVTSTLILGLGAATCFNSDSESALSCGVAIVGVVAIPATMAIDAALFAYDEPTAPEEGLASTRVMPWVDQRRSATGLVWAGRF